MKDIPPENKTIVDKSHQWLRLVLFVILWIAISIGYTTYTAGRKTDDIAYSESKEKVAAGDVATIRVQGQNHQPQSPAVFSTVCPVLKIRP
ncbi:MAG: hypothetical protein AB1Z16_04965 [Desulfotignum sp.]